MRVNRLLRTRAELLLKQGRMCREKHSWNKELLCSEGLLCMAAFLYKENLVALEGRLVPSFRKACDDDIVIADATEGVGVAVVKGIGW